MAYPVCRRCGVAVICGQTDAAGVPTHLGCQADLPPEQRHPRLAEFPTSHSRRPPAQREDTMTDQPDGMPLLEDAIVGNDELSELSGIPVELLVSAWDEDES